MPGRPLQLTVIVGDCDTATNVRALLQAHGVSHLALASNMMSLRRRLVRGEQELLVLCIVLDEETLDRQGASLQALLADHHCSQTPVRSVGLLTDLGMTPEVAQMGCNVYVDDTAQAAEAIRQMVEDWNTQPRATMHHAAVIRDAWAYGKPDFVRSMPAAVRGAFLGKGAKSAGGGRHAQRLPRLAWRPTDSGDGAES